jgi:magnesium chelatase family protein
MFDSDEVESIDGVYFFKRNFGLDFKDIRGQKIALRAALIAAAGMHNIIFEGSPGSGKTIIARRMRYILPPLTLDEVLDIAQIEAINNSSPTFEPVRPFRAPHHSASRAAIFGSGTKNQIYIGEVTLAHHGILFFDELPHFPKNILEALREPLQDREIHISRVHIKTNNPADFVFVGAQNPCPCGNLFSKNRECRCSDIELTRYRNKISDPFWDRIDLYVAMQEVDLSETPSTSSAEMFEKVLKAFEFQRKRGQKDFNGKLTDGDVEKYIRFEPELEEILNTGISRFGLSFRSANKIKKVARTIADIEGREEILKRDILEAFSYRKRY